MIKETADSVNLFLQAVFQLTFPSNFQEGNLQIDFSALI